MEFFTSVELNSIEDLFYHQLCDIYDAEQRLTKALPKMADVASSPELQRVFQSHLLETKGHIRRLEQVFNHLGRKVKAETCPAMKGLIEESEEIMDAEGDPRVKDAALIVAAQKVEHYEMAAYGSARALAEAMGDRGTAQLLQENLDEEGEADKKLTSIALSNVNLMAEAA